MDVEIVVGVVIIWDEDTPVVIAGQLDGIGVDRVERRQEGLAFVHKHSFVLIIGSCSKLRCDRGADIDVTTYDREVKPMAVEHVVAAVEACHLVVQIEMIIATAEKVRLKWVRLRHRVAIVQVVIGHAWVE